MKKIAIELSSSTADITSIQQYLVGYDNATSIFNGTYKAEWLLNHIYANKWIIRTSKTIKDNFSLEENAYKYTSSVNWNRIMSDGTSLCDEENKDVLRFYQKVLFILIESKVVMPKASVSSLHNIAKNIFTLISWSYREDMELNTKTDMLNNLTQKRLESLIYDYTSGGIFKVTDSIYSIISRFNQLSKNKIGNRKQFKFTNSEKDIFISFLRKESMYIENHQGLKHINRKKFLSLFKICKSTSYDDRFALFLRQFEPDLINKNPDVLLPLRLEYEFPGHTTPLIKNVERQASNHRSIQGLINLISEVMKLKPLFPEYIPKAETLKFNELFTYSKNHGSRGNVTPWIPLPICLNVLNKSIQLLLNEGDKIIDCVTDVYNALIKEGLLINKKITNKDLQSKKNGLIKDAIKKYQKDLGVTTFSPQVQMHISSMTVSERLRNETTLYHKLKLLKAACFIIIAGLKPIRINEISRLQYDCLFHKENDGFWLMQDLEKAGINGILPEDAKPIPYIAAKAISLLRRFNDHANSVYPSEKEQQYLLYSLNYGYDNSTASIDNKETIRDVLSVFCDYHEIPTDKYGRRWYINTHELRKSFLLTFFWSFKYSSLDACRWIAGHSNPDHVFHYIEANIPGEEMVEVEAEYARQQLQLFTSDNTLSDIENIEELYDDVCSQFSVKSITEISESELTEWLYDAIESGKYEIYAYGIESQDSNHNATVAIKII